MNRKNVSAVTGPQLDSIPKAGNLPFVKVRSIGDNLIEKYSPIVNGKIAATKKKPPHSSTRKRNPWTKDEDDRLVALINQELGKTDTSDKKETAKVEYVKIASLLNSGRTAKQCRDRWQNFLRDGIKKGDWSADEEDLIKDLYITFGAKWSVMAKLFKNRTDNDVKNKWYSMKRKDERNGTNECKNPFANTKIGATLEKHSFDTAHSLLSSNNLNSESLVTATCTADDNVTEI